MRVLLIDNYDSYTYNLAQLMGEVYGRLPHVVANDAAELTVVDETAYDAIAISPGPGRPDNPRDLGHCAALLRRTRLPVLGICLGHQAIGWLAGAEVVPAPAPRHGHVDRIRHTGTGLFQDIPQDFPAVRYHSLCVVPSPAARITPLAWAADKVVMALRHTERPWWGVQFHPESVATEHGPQLLRNFARLARMGSGAVPVAPATGATAGGATAVRGRPDGRARSWRLRVRTIDRAVATDWLFQTFFAGSDHAFWLDSSLVAPGLSRFSFLGDAGGPYGEVLSYRAGSGTVRVDAASGSSALPGSIFDVIETRLRERAVTPPAALPFDLAGGYVGYFGYELKRDYGAATAHVSPLPDAVWLSATRYVAVDHHGDRTYIVALTPAEADSAPADRWTGEISRRIDAAAPPGRPLGTATPWPSDPPEAARRLMSALVRPRATYLADIETCQRLLRAGESYEICLTNTVELPFTGDPLDFYYRQRLLNPAPYAAYLRLGGAHVMCSSPERFLRITRDRGIESRPIKGTAPRGHRPRRDRALRHRLASSAKTRAENLMIVDLLRNDLGRVCEVGSVHVPRFMAVETYATMHQLVSTIRGRLRPGVSPLTAVRHCFPGGSMTGAPKLRTMEIIDQLETRARGVYSGAIGYFGLTGAADLNIVIRTAVAHNGHLTVGAGGAIVLDSDPLVEFDEMLLKAQAPLRPLLRAPLAAPETGDERRWPTHPPS